MIEKARKSLRICGGVLLVAMLLVVLTVVAPQVVGADHSYTVVSDSMQPTIHAGDVIYVRETPHQNIKRGDIITFDSGEDGTKPTTHRVIDVVRKNDGVYFQTKGDANEEADPSLVPSENLIGQVMFHIPYIGYLLTFARSKIGIGLLVILPAALLVITEIRDLVMAYRRDTDRDDSNPRSTTPESVGDEND